MRAEHALVAGLRLDVEELPDRRPEPVDVLDRPPPQRVVVAGDIDAARVGDPAREASDRRVLDLLLARFPQDGRLLGRAHGADPRFGRSSSTARTRSARTAAENGLLNWASTPSLRSRSRSASVRRAVSSMIGTVRVS